MKLTIIVSIEMQPSLKTELALSTIFLRSAQDQLTVCKRTFVKTRQRAKPTAHSYHVAGIRGTMHSETDKSDSTIRLRVYQLTTSAQTPTCGIARVTRVCVCVYAIGGRLESPHGTVGVLKG